MTLTCIRPLHTTGTSQTPPPRQQRKDDPVICKCGNPDCRDADLKDKR